VLAPGDDVLIEFPKGTGKPVVRAVATRKSKLSRLAHVHSRLEEQVIAANVDVLVIVASTVQPAFRPGLVDRYLIVAEVGGVTPLLVVNKVDLAPEEPADVQPYRELGVTVLNTSCVTAQGIASLRAALSGKRSVVAGHSGVGKSSLINALDPSLAIVTDEVSISTEKGRHTTTTARLYTLADNIRIIDTAGARSLGLWSVSSEELAYYFPEMAELAGGCRFRNCTHVHEPACAIREAVESGDLPKQRYASYLRIRASL
jgi:ribosome biogenesis GTPase